MLDWFGPKGFVKSDLRLVRLWANMIDGFSKKVSYLPDKDNMKDYGLFTDFAQICKEISHRFRKL